MLRAIVWGALLACAAASARAEPPARLAWIYVEANTGSSSGGHVALLVRDTVYHVQQWSDGLFRIEREEWPTFRYLYAGLGNRTLALAPARTRLVREGDRWVTRRLPATDSPVRLLLPVAESAAWLLEHGDPSLVRRCGGERCVLVFYDGTKNRSRRWCSMDGCGSRAKAAAYYRRKQRGRGAAGPR